MYLTGHHKYSKVTRHCSVSVAVCESVIVLSNTRYHVSELKYHRITDLNKNFGLWVT